jgi:hypothetical protein
MIKYEWRTELSPAEAGELADLLHRAAEYDAEPGYSGIDFADIQRSMTSEGSADKHLVIWMLPYSTAMAEPDTAECIAGLVRLTPVSPGAAQATAVVDPRLRSIGIMTLLVEQLGLDTSGPDGWCGTGAHTITSWARGNHPAAGRLSNRFLIPRTRQVWQLIRSTTPEEDVSAAPVLEPITRPGEKSYALRENRRVVAEATLDRHRVASEEFGDCAVVENIQATPASHDVLRRLLEGLAVIAHEAGRSGLIINVDSDDTDLVNVARRVGFQHDRTDVRYQLGSTGEH